MSSRRTGAYVASTVTGETVRAFVPRPLPPQPALRLDDGGATASTPPWSRSAGSTHRPAAAGRLFLYAYVRKEAVLSSQIEGTQSSLSDLLLFELDEAPGVPLDDVVEVSNYVAALDHGWRGCAAGSRSRTG